MADPLADVTRVLVVGLGRSGRAAVDALLPTGVELVVAEAAAGAPGVDELRARGVEVHLSAEPGDHLDGVDLVVPSPGVPEHAEVFAAADARGIAVWSEPELGWRLHPRRVVAVTGTNGKTSVTELVAAMLSAAGADAVPCGNIGHPFVTAAAASSPEAVLVAELSSFQLRFCSSLRPEAGVLLNVSADHLDWHGTVEAYGAAKARMWRAQGEQDWAVANADDERTRALAQGRDGAAALAWFSGDRLPLDGTDVAVGRDRDRLVSTVPGRRGPVVATEDLAIDAPHHRANVAAASLAALLVGAERRAVGAAAAGFRPGRHRLEVVAEVGGVVYVDDSKATNVGAVEASLAAFPSVVWIAGGLRKGVDLTALRSSLGNVRAAVLIGEAAPELADLCASEGIPASQAASMDEAVAQAASWAQPGDAVLLAPACASFDMFEDYADRGDRFAAAARRVAEGEGHDGGR